MNFPINVTVGIFLVHVPVHDVHDRVYGKHEHEIELDININIHNNIHT